MREESSPMLRCGMRGTAGRAFVAAMLALTVAIAVLEVSGRWDRTFQDANDEAGIIAIVLCIGVSLIASRTLLGRIHLSRGVTRHGVTHPERPSCEAARIVLSTSSGPPISPPASLRI